MEKNKIGMIVIIAILVLMLAGVGVGLFITIRSLGQLTASENGSKETVAQLPEYTTKDLKIFNVNNDIKANLMQGSDGGEHLVLMSISLAVNSKIKGSDKFLESLADQEVIIRDIALRVVKNKRFEDLKKPDAQQALGDEILAKLQLEFDTNMIVAIYFGEFLLQ